MCGILGPQETERVVNAADYSPRHKPKGSARSSPDDRDMVYAQQPTYVALAHVKGLTVDNLGVSVSAMDRCRSWICTTVNAYQWCSSRFVGDGG